MKKLLSGIILLACAWVSAFGAGFPYVVGNPITVTATNFYANTNNIVITGAGTASANGTFFFSKNYTDATESAPGSIYTNVAGTFGINTVNPPGLDYGFTLTNATGTLIYSYSISAMGTPWDNGYGSPTGANPKPTSQFGNYTSNRTSVVISPAFELPSFNTNVWYVNCALGDDVFALKNRIDRPYKTLAAAWNAATTNDTIIIAPGNYVETVQPVGNIVGLSIVGSGRGNTIISGAKEWRLANSNYVANLTTDWTFTTGAAYASPTAVTNSVIQNVKSATPASDCFFGVPYGGGIWNSELIGLNDVLAFPSSSTFMTNSAAAFQVVNCSLTGGSGAGSGLSLQGYARIYMSGGMIKVGNPGASIGQANGTIGANYNTNTVVIVNGAIFISPTTANFAFMSSNNGVVILTNNCTLRLNSY